MCLPALAAVPAIISSAGAAIGGAVSAIPGFASVAGAAKGAFALAKTAKGISALSTGLGIGQSVLGYMGQRQEAAMQEQAYAQNRASALRAYQDDIVALNADTMVTQDQATERRNALRGEALASRAGARVAVGEAGVGGFTAAAIHRDLLAAEGTGIAAIDRNENLSAVRYQYASRAAGETARGRIGSVSRGTPPSLLALGANIGGAAFQGLRMFKQMKAEEAVA